MSSSRASQEAAVEPQRLSALYQFHNAPEVAPANGLEYDDTIYPSSDKCAVIHEHSAYHKYGQHGYHPENRPPRIIFGMKVGTFMIVASIMSLVIIGAAIGGAVGGQQLRSNGVSNGSGVGMLNNVTTTTTPTFSPSTTTSSSSSSSSTFSAATPTYTPLSDCPASNATLYTSTYAQTTSTSSIPATAALTFTKYCSLLNPFTTRNAYIITEAFVYSFSDCIEICAGYNYYHGNATCTVAVYSPGGSRPGNCWVGGTGPAVSLGGGSGVGEGLDVALVVLPGSEG